MRFLVLLAAVLFAGLAAGSAAGPARAEQQDDLGGLERTWKDCVRDAFTHQPPGQSKAGGQRNALDECQSHEDAYVKAAMAARTTAEARPGGRSMTARAREWAASVAAYVVDPVSSWLAILGR